MRSVLTAVLLAIIVSTASVPAAPGESDGEDEKVFTLPAAIERALVANRSVVGAGYGVEGSRIGVEGQASEFDLKVAPVAGTGFTGSDTVDDSVFRVGAGFRKKFDFGLNARVSPAVERSGDEWVTSVDLGLSLPLMRGFGTAYNRDGIERAEFTVRRSRRSLHQTRVRVVLETVGAAYEIARQREMIALHRSRIDRLRRHVAASRIRERSGLGTPLDIYRAEIRLKDAEDALPLAREARSSAEDRVRSLLVLPLDARLRIQTPMDYEPVDITAREAVEIALARRVEMDQARDELAEARRRAVLATQRTRPELNLVLNYRHSGFADALTDVFEVDEKIYTLNLESATDWARTQEKLALRQSQLDVRSRELALASREDEVRRGVRARLNALAQARKRIELRRKQIAQAQGKLALAAVKFEHGLGDNFTLLEAETELQRARTNLLAVETEYIVGIYRLRASMGTLMEM